jgi:diguanylate cyclase (GGDEF)-like protein/PAS domain S-box-containing protein
MRQNNNISLRALFLSLFLLLQNSVYATTTVQLNEDEVNWLEAHPTIRLAVDINWPPFEYIDAENNYVGMAADYIALIAEKLGIQFEVEKERAWTDAVEAVKRRELDMYSCVVSTLQRREYVNFTRPYLSFPMIIVTSDQVAYVDGLKGLKNQTIAVVKGYATHDLLVENHPELKLYLAENVSEALEALSLGKVYAYIGNIASVSNILRREGLTNIKISGETPYKYELSMAVRNDWPELTPIIQKALDSITEDEHDQIYQRWIKLRFEHGFDYQLFWQVLVAVLLIMTVILYWNRRLTTEISRRVAVEEALHSAHRHLALGLRGGDLGTWDWDLATNQIRVNERWLTMLGYPADELEIDFDFWAGLLHPDDIEPTQKKVEQHLSGEVDFYDNEFRLKANSGEYKWIRARGQIVNRNPSGQAIQMAGVHQDVTGIKQAQQQLKDYVDIVDKYVITSSTDKGGIITYVSEAFCEISGYSEQELIGNNHRIVRHEDMPASIYDELWGTISQGKSWVGELKNKKKNGDHYWVHAFISPNFDTQGNLTGFTAIRQDITDQKRVEELSITDELTSLYNRRHFNRVLPHELALAEREHKIIALMILDVDFFKPYNDHYGHQQGDVTLRAVAGALDKTLRRAGDYAFRLGGEEFGGLVTVTDREDAVVLAERVRQAVEALQIEHAFNTASPFVTISIGLKIHQSTGNPPPTMDAFFRMADDALYQAKDKGRNQVVTR